MIASLGMYDWAEIKAETDALWHLTRDHLRTSGLNVPDDLTCGSDLWELWQRPDLILGHTCGFPYRTALHPQVALVGTPDYGLRGAPPGYYYSLLIVRADALGVWQDFVPQRLAINAPDSQSGWAAPQNLAAEHGLRFGRLVVTGEHLESARAVAEGHADIGAIDAVTWRLIKRFRPEIALALKVIAHTEPTPGLPFITARQEQAAIVAEALGQAIAATAGAPPGLRGLVFIPTETYLSVPTPPAPTAAELTG